MLTHQHVMLCLVFNNLGVSDSHHQQCLFRSQTNHLCTIWGGLVIYLTLLSVSQHIKKQTTKPHKALTANPTQLDFMKTKFKMPPDLNKHSAFHTVGTW